MANRHGPQNGLRRRLREAVEQRYGEVRTDTLRELASRADVHHTVLAKFLWYQDSPHRTGDIRSSNLLKIATALGTSPEWLRDGVKTQQRDIWPFALPSTSDAKDIDPAEEVKTTLRELRKLPHAVQVRACREAVATMLGIVSASGVEVPLEAYGCLIRLDHLQRTVAA